MRFGVREICDVVLKAKAKTQIGNKVFYKNEPVLYFDSLKTSGMEGAATTVYAQGGRGNSRLVAWEGERTVTFTMEDALISPEGFMILSGAGLIEATNDKPIYQHVIERTDAVEVISDKEVYVYVKNLPHMPANKGDNFAYIMLTQNDDVVSEPFIPVHTDAVEQVEEGEYKGLYKMVIQNPSNCNVCVGGEGEDDDNDSLYSWVGNFKNAIVMVDYYVARKRNAQQIEITPDKFGGNYYLEASTLFRNTDGVDMPAEFVIPNCKIQSNFNFTMASSGDPSTFTFTMDAFPDYTRFDPTKKVLAAIQIITDEGADVTEHRHSTPSVLPGDAAVS